MIDIKKIRENTLEIETKLSKRGREFPEIAQIKELDREYRLKIANIGESNFQRNSISKQIADLLKEDKNASISDLQQKVINIKENIVQEEKEADEIKNKIQELMLTIPNVPHSSVVFGKTEEDNVEMNKWSDPKQFDFQHKAHWDLAKENDFVDFDLGVKISGSRFTVYKGEGARLMRALIQLTLDMNTKAGFLEVLPPVIVNAKTLTGTGQLPKFEEDLYGLKEQGFYLSPTAEVQLTNIFADKIVAEEKLPYLFTANTACFRSEAGAAGKDTKGVIRQHQFYKTELVIISHPNNSYENHELMTRQAEKILEALKLPYRRIMLCTGDQGFGAAKTYDIEVWLPSYNAYKEISSCSNCEDFQARRLKIRFKNNDGEAQYVHTLNGSGLAIDRLWAAVVENYQTKNGQIEIPIALQKYMDNKQLIGNDAKTKE